ncbi:DMT family transporter [Microbacterium oryzae]|uniref:EamA family transporter n=1 Tax=Microbacterium oryzae TaxID=743009 RepID=A0A6I6DTC1_9MICO|nr:EamA family transporter [Microbacterium oryzae]QGU28255.1 EamA family transporter [Microbacterium oryzae]
MALVLGSCVSLQFGATLAVQLFPALGSWGVSALRLTIAALVLLVAVRPRVRGWNRGQWLAVIAFGLSLTGMNGFFYAALERIPLGTAVAIEFLGPLVLAAVLTRRLLDFAWVALALVGMALLGVDSALGVALDGVGVVLTLIAAAFWALYIRASARVGQLVPGMGGLAVALVVASVALLPFGVPAAAAAFAEPHLLALAAGTALLASVVPYTLELLALRRLPQRVFGVLLSLEPVVAAAAGWLLLSQEMSALRIAAVALVVAASIGTALAARKASEDAPGAALTGEIPVIRD